MRYSKIWRFFALVDKKARLAKCRLCNNTFSCKSTITNLRVHLKRCHTEGTDEALRALLEDDSEIYVEYFDEESNNSSKEPTIDIWSYFERESDDRARCALCRTSLPNFRELLDRHLKEKHPKLITEEADEDSDVVLKDDDPDNMYTEVIYLEEEQDNGEEQRREEKSKSKILDAKSVRRKLNPLRVQTEPSKTRLKRRESRSSEECIVKKPKVKQVKSTSTTIADEDDYEIESFGKYITCLLKKLPRNVCRKLQMNIVNLIMSANLNEESNKIVETVPITIQRLPIQTEAGTSYIMVSEKGEGAQNVTLTSTPHIDDVQNHVNISNSCDIPASTALSTVT